MIKFFRKIRQNLLMENKTGKYFKYAIGEIVLVVIGILFALQINTWNNNRIERNLEQDSLNEILDNLEFDLNTIDKCIEGNERYIKYNLGVVEHLENRTPLTDSLKYYYAFLYAHQRFQPLKVGYENLKSRGLNIIRNQTLRKKISELYEYQYFFLAEDIRNETVHINAIHKNQTTAKLKTEKKYSSAQPIDLIALQNDIQFHETLKDFALVRSWSNGRYEFGKKEIIEAIGALKNELNKN